MNQKQQSGYQEKNNRNTKYTLQVDRGKIYTAIAVVIMLGVFMIFIFKIADVL